MKTLEEKVFKVLTGQISLSEFEKLIYQKFYIQRMNSDKLLYSAVTINYKKISWKYELELLIKDSWDEMENLIYTIAKSCLQILQIHDEKTIFDNVAMLSQMNSKWSYKYETLMQFYSFVDQLSLTQYGYASQAVLLASIKDFSKLYLDKLYKNKDFFQLLNLSLEDIEMKKKKKEFSDFKMIIKNKKWF